MGSSSAKDAYQTTEGGRDRQRTVRRDGAAVWTAADKSTAGFSPAVATTITAFALISTR
jgi:hypothetical protein